MPVKSSITVSAPCKVHLLGEHSVVYGKPAILTSVNLRIRVTVIPLKAGTQLTKSPIQKVIEPIVKKNLKIKRIPPYKLEISSQIPIGSHLGSSAAISATLIAALLSLLKVNWDLNLVNELAYQAEKFFQGKPSGADNSTVIFGGLIWYRKESDNLKLIQPLPFTIPHKLAKNFIFINTGTPKEITARMVSKVKALFRKNPKLVERFLENQEVLTRKLLPVIKDANEKQLIKIIRQGERNLESIGVCSPEVKKIIRKIEKAGGAAKICGAGSDFGPTGVLLCYHPKPSMVKDLAKSYKLSYFMSTLGVEGLRKEYE